MIEYYALLLGLCKDREVTLRSAYRQLRELLEKICYDLEEDKGLQMTDLSAKVGYVSTLLKLSPSEENRLHTFRITSNRVLNAEKEGSREELLRDIKTLAFFVRRISGEDIPKILYAELPRQDATYIAAPPAEEKRKQMRVSFRYADDEFLYVVPRNETVAEPLRVRCHQNDINAEFDETLEQLWPHAQLNLLDVDIDREGILLPRFIILEPDYLLDISSLAECFKEYGHHPANYLYSRLQPHESTAPMLLGNIANLFLDEWINSAETPDYLSVMKKAFKMYALELAASPELRDRKKEMDFFNSCRMHFDNISRTVTETFKQPGYRLDIDDAVLEPSYICEALGLQGRLDYMQRDRTSFIEMKSGKADEFSIRGKIVPKENNTIQMLLYQAVLEYSRGMDHRNGKAYLLYTRYPMLYPARTSWSMLRRVMNVRNLIVAREFGVQLHNNEEYTEEIMKELQPDILNQKQLDGTLWNRYICPQIKELNAKIDGLNSLEKSYFLTLYNFITKELYTSKSGDIDHEGCTGASSLWNATFEEKLDSGEILYDLRMKENHASDAHKAHIRFEREKSKEEMPPNFREGDAVVLYERNTQEENVTNRMVFKGNIEQIGEGEVTVRLRASQRNVAVLPENSSYAVEHDYMDTTFRGMYQGLSAFLYASRSRRDLLLGQRKPQFSPRPEVKVNTAAILQDRDFCRVIAKAAAAEDYFLLVGPPGTGKTSMAIKGMVEHFYNCGKKILLLSYTNRAVDELCKSLSRIDPPLDFIRVGSEISCDPAYRDHLIENVVEPCERRSDVQKRIEECDVFLGTVATLSSKTELFRLKTFDVAIIDEATQILEPQLLGLLCRRDGRGEEVIRKFVMVGDHKQLPAVVLQSAEQSEVRNPSLRAIGLTNLKDSLFERLFRAVADEEHEASQVYDMLCRHGRMNPEVALFPNRHFYRGLLEPVGLPHQKGDLPFPASLEGHPLERYLKRRVSFIPSVAEPLSASQKQNRSEARIAAELAEAVFHLYTGSEEGFDSSSTLGIIAPYRSQIALIRKELEKRNIAQLNEITVDTVERFQGSERDVIIYSFCANRTGQLRFLSNTTEERGVLIDRKLNVALTRARRQLFLTGVEEILAQNQIFRNLIGFINS